MALTLATPALLFGAISLLILAYTNRFLALAALIRSLHDRYRDARDEVTYLQIAQLRRRVRLVQTMQTLGAASFFVCLLTMLVLFADAMRAAQALFALSLVLLMASLALSILEIRISVGALDLQLADLEAPPGTAAGRYPRVTADVPPPVP